MKNAKQTPLVSVVTPFYNTCAHIAQCIESVLTQSYEHWEYILVNNQSTDGSDDIAAQYAQRDGRIKLIQVPNFLPQVSNFNFALTHLSADSIYCKMILADDWLFPRCLEDMVAVAEQNTRIGLVSSYRIIGTRVSGFGLDATRTHFSGHDIGRRQLRKECVVFGSESTFLYRSEILRSRRPFFSETSFHSDTEAAYEILRAWDFGFTHQVLTYTRLEARSISGRVRSYSPHLQDFLITVEKYADDFLTPKEAERCRLSERRVYYGFLAKAIWLGRWQRGFWEFQLMGLRTAGIRIHRRRFAWECFRALLTILGNPKMAVEMVLNRRPEP